MTIASRAVATSAKMVKEQSSMKIRPARSRWFRGEQAQTAEMPPVGSRPPRSPPFRARDLTFAPHQCQHEQGLIFYKVGSSTYPEERSTGLGTFMAHRSKRQAASCSRRR